MANEEHLNILKQGVQAWNQWTKEHPEVQPDLSHTDLIQADLSGMNLAGADLAGTDLTEADLTKADLAGTDLTGAELFDANLLGTNLTGADLTRADLFGAKLNYADLTAANLTGADLTEVNFTGANVIGANLLRAKIGWTVFGYVDLSRVEGLETVNHEGPSIIGIDTIYRSQGRIPKAFLRGAGVPESFIQDIGSLMGKALQYYSCFISHSAADKEFAKQLFANLQAEGVRCWFAPEHMKIGDKIRVSIDESIRVYDKLLLVLSKHSVNSQWVEKEVETALEKERDSNRLVLFPVRLDDTVMQIKTGWPADIRRTRQIGDFREWKDHDSYQKAFKRLMRDLKSKQAPPPAAT